MLQASQLRSYLHGKSFSYNPKAYDFKGALEELYGCELSRLHKYMGPFPRFTRSNDQYTLAHRVFYANYAKCLKTIYNSFVHDIIAPIIFPHKAFCQVIPTFRVGLPGNIFVGEYHKDSAYNHQSYELNFNVGLCNYVGSSSLRAEALPSSGKFITLECPYGSVFSFDHIDCLHGSDPNDTAETIVSFDFRLALKELYYDNAASSVNMGTSFRPGSYFSNQAIN